MEIRKDKCSRCSCINAMKEIHHFNKNPPKSGGEATSLDEILSYGELQGELFQCYMDNNGIKCKGLHEFTNFLIDNPGIEQKLRNNLQIYKNKNDT